MVENDSDLMSSMERDDSGFLNVLFLRLYVIIIDFKYTNMEIRFKMNMDSKSPDRYSASPLKAN